MKREETVFAIVVTYNGAEWISKCLNSLQDSTVRMKIIVIDNFSQDSTVSIVANNFPEVELIVLESNLGFGRANNIGIEKAVKFDADYVFLLNQDAWIETDTIEKLIAVQIKNREFGILAPVQLDKTKREIDHNFLYYMYRTRNLFSEIYSGVPQEVYSTEFANAAGWLISRECILKVGLFDPFFFHYSEDRNFCHRTLYHGLKVGICPRIAIVHDRATREKDTSRHSMRKEHFREELADLLDIRKMDFGSRFKVEKRTKWRNIIKALLALDVERCRQNYSELKHLVGIEHEMKESFTRNKIGGTAYLTRK